MGDALKKGKTSGALNRVAIIGVGLIGGSIGMAFARKEDSPEIVGYDLNPSVLEDGIRLGAIHRKAESLSEAVEGADLVFLTAPVQASIAMLEEVMAAAKGDCIITDVCSTKAHVMRRAEELRKGSDFPRVFIGGHPMAGSEEAGIAAADPYLFENAMYILTPPDEGNFDNECRRLKGIIEEYLGAHVITMNPDEHDTIVASVSHLPHIVASLLVKTAARIGEEHGMTLPLAAGGFRDTTRIALGNPVMWRDILITNRKAIDRVIALFLEELNCLRELIREGDGESIIREMELVREIRKGIPKKTKGFITPLFEIVVSVKDEPGSIGNVARLLGDGGVNIKDIEILRVREGEGGTLKIGFASPEDVANAVTILRSSGYTARERERG